MRRARVDRLAGAVAARLGVMAANDLPAIIAGVQALMRELATKTA